jgi:mannan endo-1,4-beta-mannosidase
MNGVFSRKYFFLSALLLSALLSAQPGVAQIETGRQQSHWPINETLVTKDASDATRRLYQFLYDNYGSKIISGVMTLHSFDEVNWLLDNTGKQPALVGLDFMHCGRNYNWYNNEEPINDARTYYDKNGIPAFCWHWRDPSRKTEEFYTAKTDFNVLKIFEPESAEYKAMLADIDYVGSLLKKLQQDDVPVIWRPLHEAKGGWFWWGAKGPDACKKLYQLMFDRLVNYHGLNNLIWVWTREPDDEQWYPGDEYVDIIGRDLYKEGDHSSQFALWSDMNNLYGEKKMVTLSECGSFPNPDNLVTDGAAWSWFMPWYGGFVRDEKNNSLALWKKTMDHPYVITLDEMPNLRTYEPAAHPLITVNGETKIADAKVYPTEVKDTLYITSSHPIGNILFINASGQTVKTLTIRDLKVEVIVTDLKPGWYVIKSNKGVIGKILKK